MPFDLILDVVIAVLLIATIAYAFLLNRRLAGLRRDKQELESLAATFGQATIRAEESIGKLKVMAAGLDSEIDRAQALRDDLVFLSDRGSAAADQLEKVIREARQSGAAPGVTTTGQMADPVAVAEAADRVKSQLAKGALSDTRNVGVEPLGYPPKYDPESRGNVGSRDQERPDPLGDDDIHPKSDAEKELLKALRAAR